MPGVGTLLKQAQKAQKKMEAIQAELAALEMDVSSGGGAVVVRVNGQQEIRGLRLDPELLKEERAIVEEAILTAIREAMAKSKAVAEERMSAVSSAFSFPGFGA